jgi:hypothetical protein
MTYSAHLGISRNKFTISNLAEWDEHESWSESKGIGTATIPLITQMQVCLVGGMRGILTLSNGFQCLVRRQGGTIHFRNYWIFCLDRSTSTVMAIP